MANIVPICLLIILQLLFWNTAFSQCGLNFQVIKQDVVCEGDCNGQASINGGVTGGSGNYSYLWSGGETTQFATNLCAGIYSLTVTDVTAGCDTVVTIEILEPLAVQVTINDQDACNGLCNGTAILNAGGGGGNPGSPYTYVWVDISNMDTTTGNIDSILTFSSLCAGNYAVTITDPLGCSATSSCIISQSVGYVTTTVSQNTLCPNECTGSINVSAVGGAIPYTFYWSTGDTAAGHSQGTILPNLCAGTYQVTITDSVGCTMIDSATIYEPSPLIPSLLTNDASCPGICDGNASVTAQGGAGSYTFYWNTTPSSSNSSVSNLCAGTYSYVVADANGCDTTDQFTISDESAMELMITNNAVCSGDMSAAVVAVNGDPPYSYAWSNGQTSSIAMGLEAGLTYNVTVTDDKGCTQLGTTVMDQPLCEIDIPNTFSPNEDGINDTWDIKNLEVYTDCEIHVYNRWGDRVYHSVGYLTPWNGSSGSGSLPSAVYYYVINVGSINQTFSGSVTLLR